LSDSSNLLAGISGANLLSSISHAATSTTANLQLKPKLMDGG
jgi:hypothetical protein